MGAAGRHGSLQSQFTIWNVDGFGKIYSSYELAKI